ncbi:serine hydrolase [Pseudonocardia saturnea]
MCACLAVLALAIPVIATQTRPAPMASVQPSSGPQTSPAMPPPVAAPPFGEAPARTAPPRLAQAAVDAAQAAAQPSTELGVAVLDRVTGETAVGARGGEPFYTASLSKLVVTVDVLDRRRTEGLVVTDADVALIRRALGPSDDSAMNVLWVRFDGVGSAARVSADLGLAGTTAPVDPSQWGEMSVPAGDFLRLYTYVLDGLPAADRDLVVGALAAAPPTAADGFDQAFGLLDPVVDGPGAPGAEAKQGWMCCFSGQYYLHSAGVVGPDERYVVVVLTRIPQGPGWAAARAEVTAVASAAVRALTGPPV